MSTLTYNGNTIQLTSTSRISHVVQYSPDQVEYQHTTVTLEVQGLLAFVSSGLGGPVGPLASGESMPAGLARLRNEFLQNRKTLVYNIGGTNVFNVGPSEDVYHGPKPVSFDVIKVMGTTALVSFTVQLHIRECSAGSVPNYTTHRWSESISIDRAGYSKRRREGRIVFRSSINQNPDEAARGIVAPPIPQGFVRESSQYTLQEDGLALHYTFNDVEQHHMPPAAAGIVEASGSYTESLPNLGKVIVDVTVRVKGHKQVSKVDLMRTAITIVVNKLGGRLRRPGEKSRAPLLMGGRFHESMYENVVEVTLRLQKSANRDRELQVPVGLEAFDRVPFLSADAIPPDVGLRGSAGLVLVAQALRDPCVAEVALRTNPIGGNPSMRTQPSTSRVSVLKTKTLPRDQDSQFDPTETNIWNDYTVKVTTKRDEHRVHLPVTKSGGGSAVIKLADATITKTVTFIADGFGNDIQVPDPQSAAGPNDVLLRSIVVIEDIKPAADGVTPAWRIGGKYVYAVKDARIAVMRAVVPPWAAQSLGNTFLQAVYDTLTFAPLASLAGLQVITGGTSLRTR